MAATPLRRDGRTNFGDIMQDRDSATPIPRELAEKLADTMWMAGDPFYRVVLTANANLQMIMSAWYNSKVEVKVVKNELCSSTPEWDPPHLRQYDRRVQIYTGNDVFCIATSRVVLTTQMAVEAVESEGVGIAQLFRHFRILPHFSLTDAGVLDAPNGERLWREYVLEAGGIECRIREEFRPDLLQPKEGVVEPTLKKLKSSPHFGNLLKGTECSNILDVEEHRIAHPLQRVLLNAAGNVVRILSSYHNAEISMAVLRFARTKNAGQYERDVLLICNSKAVCHARSVVTLEEGELRDAVETGECALGEIFRRYDLLPEFKLLEVQLDPTDPPGFGRHYTLAAPGIVCDVHEEFPIAVLNSEEINSIAPTLAGIPDIYPPECR